MIKVNVKFSGSVFNGELKRTLGVEPHGVVHKALVQEVVNRNIPYIPTDTGGLRDSVLVTSDGDSEFVVYTAPYAHYLYEGKVYSPNYVVERDVSGTPIKWRTPKGVKKHYNPNSYNHGVLRYKNGYDHWFERMKSEHLADIVNALKERIKVR